MQRALGTIAEHNQTTGQGTRLVDVLCGEECDTPQSSEPVAKLARTDDHSMNGTSDSASGAKKRKLKGPEGSDVEFLRQLVRELQAQLSEAVRPVNAAPQAAAATGSQRAASKRETSKPGRNRLWPNRLWPPLSDRLWPNRLWPNRLWPKLGF